MKEIIKEALLLCDDAQIMYTKLSVSRGNVVNGEVKELSAQSQEKWTLRVLKDGFVGESSATEIKDPSFLISSALSTLQAKQEGPSQFPSFQEDFSQEKPALCSKLFFSYLSEDFYPLCENLKEKYPPLSHSHDVCFLIEEKKVMGKDLKTLESIIKSEAYSFCFQFPTGAACFHAPLPSHIHSFRDSFEFSLNEKFFKAFQNPVKVSSGKKKVLLTPFAAFHHWMRFQHAFSAKNVYDKTSYLTNSFKQQVYSPLLNITLDPQNPLNTTSHLFDKEGTLNHSLEMVKDGIPQRAVGSSLWCEKLELSPSGHMEEFGISDISVKGTHSLEEMLMMMDEGILVVYPLGGHSGNIPAGEYSIGLALAFYVKEGEILGRVDDCMLSGNTHQDFQNLLGVSHESMECQYSLLPWFMMDQVNFTQKEA